MASGYIDLPVEGGGGSGGITSINSDTTPAQVIAAGTGISVSSVAGTTTITNTGSVTTGNLTDVGTDGIVITGGTNAVVGAGTSIAQHVADSTHNGYLSSGDWSTFNGKQSALTIGDLTDVGTDGITVTNGTGSVIGSGTSIAQQVSDSTHNGYLSSTDWLTFNGKADLASPAFTGIPTAPTAGVGTSTTQIATTAFVLSQGFTGASGSIPSTNVSSTSAVTSATTTYVTAISTTITVTATTAPIWAVATGVFTVTSAVPTVMKYRVSINGVAGQEQLLSLTALTTNYNAAVQYISASLAAGTYTILFEFARNSGTGTVNFFEGTVDAIALQGASSNGITSLSGLGLSAGPGSGAQAITGTLTMAGGGTNASLTAANGAIPYSTASALALLAPGSAGQLLRSGGAGAPTWTTATFPATTTINQILYSSAANVITGLATANTGALVTSSTGVPSFAAGGTANRVLRTNGTTVSFAQVAMATDVSGTLPFANGGTGGTAFANQRIPFSNGTVFTTNANFTFDTTNGRLNVGGSGTAIGNFINTGSSVALQAYNQGTNSAFQAQNQSAFTAALISRQNNALSGASIGFEFGRGTLATPLQALNGDQLAVIVVQAYTGTQTAPGYAGAMGFIATEDCTNTANGSDYYIATTPNTTLVPVEHFRIKQSGEIVFSNSHLRSNQTVAPTAAPNANAGTAATSQVLNATDTAGTLELVAGTLTLASGVQTTVTFNKAYTVAPIVTLTPANAGAAAACATEQYYVTRTTTDFSVAFVNASAGSITYQWYYNVIETQ